MSTMTDTVRIKVLLSQLEAIKAKGTLDGEEADRSENLHRLFMYPAMMVPATQSAIIEAMTGVLPQNSNAIDPLWVLEHLCCLAWNLASTLLDNTSILLP